MEKEFELYARLMKENSNAVFVFGSNLAGFHGAGAAKTAHELYDAEFGTGWGFTGRCYAIPSRNAKIETMELSDIQCFVNQFLKDAKNHPDKTFLVTQIGCGFAGYKPINIAPLFLDRTENCILPEKFVEVIGQQLVRW